MIEYKKTIESFEDLKELCWGGATDRLEEIEYLCIEDEFMDYLNEMLGDEKTLESDTEINDFIWFECDDWIEEHKGDEEDEEF